MRPHFITTLITALLALVFTGSSIAYGAPPAQTGLRIDYGTLHSGTITEDAPCVYFWFEGATGDPITIDMTRTSGDLDGVMSLYQQDGTNFAQDPLIINDDRPNGGLDPLISYTLPASDWYTIAACRLQAAQMRATTGTFDLTLTGPASSSANSQTEPTAAPPGLSQGLFPTGSTATPAPTAPAVPSQSGTLSGSDDTLVLEPGSPVLSDLPADTDTIRFTLAVQARDMVVIDWQSVEATFAPLLRVTDANGTIWAQATTPTPVNALTLAFYAPAADTLTLTVARHGDTVDGTGGPFTLQATTTTTAQPPSADEELESVPQPLTGDTLDNVCQIGRETAFASGSSSQLVSAYVAAGDGINPSELTPTGILTTDDDLNVVFAPQISPLPALITGIFCAPDGTFMFFDELDVTDNTVEYMFGVDWEYYNEPWEIGGWWVEIYVDDTFELALSFQVQ